MRISGGGYIISWSQTRIEGLQGPPLSALEVGATWSWSGPSILVDWPADQSNHLGLLTGTRPVDAIRRLFRDTLPPVRPVMGAGLADPIALRDFVVACGRDEYRVLLLEFAEIARPVLLFEGSRPPANRLLRIVSSPFCDAAVRHAAPAPAGIICFTPGTLLSTPSGQIPVERLAEGELLDTRDAGPQEILWIGRRRISGARMHAMPDLRPVRLCAGALGGTGAGGDLVVSPRHKILVEGPAARALFGEDEVLVAAEDLVDGTRVVRERALPEVNYIHLMLPRHHILRANGFESESFHPASTDLRTVEPSELARLEDMIPGLRANPGAYGDSVRRALSRTEAAALRSESALSH